MDNEPTIPEGLVHRDDLLVAEANSIMKVIEDLNGQIATAVMQRRRLEVVLSAIEASLNAPPIPNTEEPIPFSQ
jgi:hypothetical protein